MKLREIPYLIWYSLKSMVVDLIELLSAFKDSKTWFFIFLVMFFLSVYYKNYTLMKIALPAALVLYFVRKRQEPDYHKALKDKAFLGNNDDKIQEYYDKYRRDCHFRKTLPLGFEEYKKKEIKNIRERKHT